MAGNKKQSIQSIDCFIYFSSFPIRHFKTAAVQVAIKHCDNNLFDCLLNARVWGKFNCSFHVLLLDLSELNLFLIILESNWYKDFTLVLLRSFLLSASHLWRKKKKLGIKKLGIPSNGYEWLLTDERKNYCIQSVKIYRLSCTFLPASFAVTQVENRAETSEWIMENGNAISRAFSW